ncbi:hypothetical protein D9758_007739 [Tetrapyrgos nigripes]|uniref:Uncharacterized protein n=1 Tax=Tetrapyrgos nigripes TaxID=182062 RepID=A0A8H5G5A3_9AGAR|nr:hypothetical protein D9758_007739 [Tetrapyrgos nigripes]
MPAPAVYVVTVLGAVAAGLAFKEFIYDPHIKPRLEARRRNRRQRSLISTAPISVIFNARRSRSSSSSSSTDEDDDSLNKGHPVNNEDRNKLKDLKNMKDMGDLKKDGLFEMETLSWGTTSSSSRPSSSSTTFPDAHVGTDVATASASGIDNDMGTLRPRNRNSNTSRRNPIPMDSSFTTPVHLDEQFPPMVPTHIIASSSESGSVTPSTSGVNSINASRMNSPLPPLPLPVPELTREAEPTETPSASVTTLRSPPLQPAQLVSSSPSTTSPTPVPIPTPVPMNSTPIPASQNPWANSPPSLSLSYGYDHDHDLDIVSNPSSRAISPPISIGSIGASDAESTSSSSVVFRVDTGSEGQGGDEEDEESLDLVDVGADSRPISPFSTSSMSNSMSMSLSQISSASGNGSVENQNHEGEGDHREGDDAPPHARSPFDGPRSLGSSMVSLSEGTGPFDGEREGQLSQSYYYTPQSAHLDLDLDLGSVHDLHPASESVSASANTNTHDTHDHSDAEWVIGDAASESESESVLDISSSSADGDNDNDNRSRSGSGSGESWASVEPGTGMGAGTGTGGESTGSRR